MSTSKLDEPNPLFYAGLILVLGGAITVLIFAPKSAKPTPPPPPPPAPPAAEEPVEEPVPTMP
jgi:hypothetical protein